MRYAKQIFNGYITACGEFQNGIQIKDDEYAEIIAAFQSRPDNPDGYTYKLRAENLEWELVKLQTVEPEPLTDEEALTRYANSLTGADDPDLISASETLIEQRIKGESEDA